jgi:hypothetical protein
LFVVEPMVKRLRACELEAAKMETKEAGVVVPIPKYPVDELKVKPGKPAFPNWIVEEAKRPPWSWRAVVVALTGVAVKVPGVNGKIAVSDELDTLLLKRVQSDEER